VWAPSLNWARLNTRSPPSIANFMKSLPWLCPGFFSLQFGIFSCLGCLWVFWGGAKGGAFFLGGGHFGEIGPFYAHFSPEASKWDFWEVKFCFWPRGRHATALRPVWGSALQPGGMGSCARPLLCLGSPIREDVRVLHGVSIDADIDMRWMV
jgi:hypothetical protein